VHRGEIDCTGRTTTARACLGAIAGYETALLRLFHSLLQTFLDPLEIRMEVKCPAIFEGHLELYNGMRGWDPTARDWLDYCGPNVGTKKWGGDMCIVEVQERSGERLELGGRLYGEINDLGRPG
jgi:hypothetical protein